MVRARDHRFGPQARGKQAVKYANHDCNYTRVTGIWGTVWLEPVPETHLRRPRVTPDLAGSAFHLELPLSENRPGHRVRAVLSDAAGEVTRAEARAAPPPRLTETARFDDALAGAGPDAERLAADSATLAARAEALRARAGALSGPVVDPAVLPRLEAATVGG